MSVKLSIIIPCYNAEPYIQELLDTLTPQVENNDEVEVIIVDDGSKEPIHPKYQSQYTWLKIYRQENKGVSVARNRGIEAAKGKIISFIDADDLVSPNYVSYILSRANEDWDYMELSWKSLEDSRYTYKLNSDRDSLPNPSASTRVFRRSFIGEVRFPEKKDAAEDEYFTRHLGLKNAKHICATDYMYFYRITTPGSTYKRYMDGLTKTKRIGYYFNHVTKDMTYLIDEIKALDEEHEVFLLTRKNDLPELDKYCQISDPKEVRVFESRGEPNNYFYVIPKPIETQVVIYTSQTSLISGIATFTYSFCKQMSEYYDITVLYDSIPTEQLTRLVPMVRCIRNNIKQPITCDTLIMNSIRDRIPVNVKYKKSVQMVHCIKQQDFRIPTGRDYIVNVSKVSRDSFGDEAKDGIVINNMTTPIMERKPLLLVSSFRVDATDKQGNDERCRKFARLLDDAKIKYLWLYFADRPLRSTSENMIYCGYRQDIRPYVAKADYMVLLSGAEAFSYSLLEALEQHTPVIVTPLAQNAEMGIVDGQNGYIVPFDVEGFDANKLLTIPRFMYRHNNSKLVKKWRKLLGDSKPKGDYKPSEYVSVMCLRKYRDLQLNETLHVGDIRKMPYERAMELVGKEFLRVLK